MIEHKIESYLVTLDKFYTLRWGTGSAPKSTVSPIDWFVQVRHVESHVSREYVFFNIHDLMTINDLDSIFKAIKDKHMVALAHFPSVHAERAHRQKLIKRVQDLEQRFKDIFHND